MAKKKPKNVSATSQDRHTSPRLAFHLPQWLLDAIGSEATANDRTKTAEILRVLKAHYRELGYSPPPDEEGGGK